MTALSGTEHEVFWLRLEENARRQESRPIPLGINVVDWREKTLQTTWLDYLKLKDQFKQVVADVRPDIVHAGPIQRVALLPALVQFHPLLSMSWGFDLLQDAYRDLLWRVATRFVLKHSDWFTADCRTTCRRAEAFGFPAERMTIFPWGVDHEVFNPKGRDQMRRRMGYEEDLLIVHTRSWEPRYGVDVALQGFWLAWQQEPNLRMLMLGGGSQERMVKQFVQDKGLEERILFCGYKENDELAQYYRAADVYLSASHIDGSSVALMESMACACPALVSNIPSNLEWIKAGKQGWVFRDGDAHDLAERILEIAHNRNELPLRGAAAQRKAQKDADWNKSVEKLLQTYQQMVP